MAGGIRDGDGQSWAAAMARDCDEQWWFRNAGAIGFDLIGFIGIYGDVGHIVNTR